MKIKMDSRIGACNLLIEANADCGEKLGNAAMQKIVFHDSASFAFREKSPFKRDSAYSPELGEHCESIVRSRLAEIGFSDILIKTSEYIKPSEFSRFEKQMKSLGFDSAWIADAWKHRPQENGEKPAESETLS